MRLAAGARLGVYEVLAPLGAGGMGEVYRARDVKLGREVALKVLARTAAGDLDYLRRFEEEARLASTINHPNIVTIYGVGEERDVAYIAIGRLFERGASSAYEKITCARLTLEWLTAGNDRGR